MGATRGWVAKVLGDFLWWGSCGPGCFADTIAVGPCVRCMLIFAGCVSVSFFASFFLLRVFLGAAIKVRDSSARMLRGEVICVRLGLTCLAPLPLCFEEEEILSKVELDLARVANTSVLSWLWERCCAHAQGHTLLIERAVVLENAAERVWALLGVSQCLMELGPLG